jgi:hypothetical protein
MPGIVFYSRSLLQMAYASALRAQAAVRDDAERLTDDSLTAIVLAASAAEGFMNDLVGIVGAISRAGVAPSTGDSDRLVRIAEALHVMEEDRCAVRPKFLVAALLLGNPSIRKGADPYSAFDDLFVLRNAIVHTKPLTLEETDRPGRIAENLAQRGLARPKPKREPNFVSSDTWLNQIQCPATAWWAADSATAIMYELARAFAGVADFSGFLADRAEDLRQLGERARHA